MKDLYVDAFRTAVEETKSLTGFELPEELEVYIVMLLANYVNKPDFLPHKSFIETYLILKDSRSAKDLGDTCLIVTGVFPSYGSKYNLDYKYFESIGISSYEKAAQTLNYQTFALLSQHFSYVRNFIELTTSVKIANLPKLRKEQQP